MSFRLELTNRGKNSRSNSVRTAITVVLECAFPTRGDRLARKLSSFNKRISSKPKDDRKLKGSTSLPLFRLHDHFSSLITKHKGVANLPELALRTAVDFFFRISLAGRTNTAYCILDDSFAFPPGASTWSEVPYGGKVSFRLAGTKSAHLDHVNCERDNLRLRPATDRQQGKSTLTSLLSITRTHHPRHENLDYFLMIDDLRRRVRSAPRALESVQIDKLDGAGPSVAQLPRLFVSISTSTRYRGQAITESTLNSALTRFLGVASAFSSSQQLQCSHIRHTVVSWVLKYCDIHSIPDSTSANHTTVRGDLFLRSMHSIAVAESTYSVHLLPDHQSMLGTLPSGLTLDALILNA